jgi:hypothetical protein
MPVVLLMSAATATALLAIVWALTAATSVKS